VIAFAAAWPVSAALAKKFEPPLDFADIHGIIAIRQ